MFIVTLLPFTQTFAHLFGFDACLVECAIDFKYLKRTKKTTKIHRKTQKATESHRKPQKNKKQNMRNVEYSKTPHRTAFSTEASTYSDEMYSEDYLQFLLEISESIDCSRLLTPKRLPHFQYETHVLTASYSPIEIPGQGTVLRYLRTNIIEEDKRMHYKLNADKIHEEEIAETLAGMGFESPPVMTLESPKAKKKRRPDLDAPLPVPKKRQKTPPHVDDKMVLLEHHQMCKLCQNVFMTRKPESEVSGVFCPVCVSLANGIPSNRKLKSLTKKYKKNRACMIRGVGEVFGQDLKCSDDLEIASTSGKHTHLMEPKAWDKVGLVPYLQTICDPTIYVCCGKHLKIFKKMEGTGIQAHELTGKKLTALLQPELLNIRC